MKPVSLNTWQFRYQSLKLVYALEHLLRARRSELKKNDALSNLINGLGARGTTYNFPDVFPELFFFILFPKLNDMTNKMTRNKDQSHKSRLHS